MADEKEDKKGPKGFCVTDARENSLKRLIELGIRGRDICNGPAGVWPNAEGLPSYTGFDKTLLERSIEINTTSGAVTRKIMEDDPIQGKIAHDFLAEGMGRNAISIPQRKKLGANIPKYQDAFAKERIAIEKLEKG